MRPAVSVVIPVFHDTEALGGTLAATNLDGAEIIVAATAEDRAGLEPLARAHPHVVWIEAPRGRASQMNAGAAAAHAPWLLFLHADTRLPTGWTAEIARVDADSAVALGCFRFALDSKAVAARLLELAVRARVACWRLPYGDQALFVRRDLFEAIGGYGALPIMEDVDLVRRLRRRGRLFVSPLAVTTSARRWERDGWVRRTATNVALILLYSLGISPQRLQQLARLYNDAGAADVSGGTIAASKE